MRKKIVYKLILANTTVIVFLKKNEMKSEE